MNLCFQSQRHSDRQITGRTAASRFRSHRRHPGKPIWCLAIVMRTFAVLAITLFTARFACADILINGNFEAGDTGFTASAAYTYSASTDVGPGDYGVLSNPQEAGSAFFSIGDHTTGTGKMLFVDASPTPLTAFWSETVPVTPDTDYSFSGFAREVDTFPNTATLRLLVDASALGADAPLGLGSSSGNWQAFGDEFNSGANTSITLSLVDANPNPATGNDFVVDDLSLSPTPVPEPHSAVLVAIGAAILLGFSLKRRFDVKHSPA